MKLGRRTVFFAMLAVACVLLWEPTPSEFRWVNLLGAVLASIWSFATALEDRALARWRPPRPDEEVLPPEE